MPDKAVDSRKNVHFSIGAVTEFANQRMLYIESARRRMRSRCAPGALKKSWRRAVTRCPEVTNRSKSHRARPGGLPKTSRKSAMDCNGLQFHAANPPRPLPSLHFPPLGGVPAGPSRKTKNSRQMAVGSLEGVLASLSRKTSRKSAIHCNGLQFQAANPPRPS